MIRRLGGFISDPDPARAFSERRGAIDLDCTPARCMASFGLEFAQLLGTGSDVVTATLRAASRRGCAVIKMPLSTAANNRMPAAQALAKA